jgi:hypothetical protein
LPDRLARVPGRRPTFRTKLPQQRNLGRGELKLNEDRRCLIVDGHAVTRIGVRKLLDPDYDVEEASTS